MHACRRRCICPTGRRCGRAASASLSSIAGRSDAVTDLDAPTFQALVQLLSDHPELTVAKLRELVESQANGRGRVRVEPIRPRSSAEVVALLEAKVISRVEAR